jgi:hypothetical protein
MKGVHPPGQELLVAGKLITIYMAVVPAKTPDFRIAGGVILFTMVMMRLLTRQKYMGLLTQRTYTVALVEVTTSGVLLVLVEPGLVPSLLGQGFNSTLWGSWRPLVLRCSQK